MVPTVIYVATIPFIGIYITSAVLIGFFMRWLGRYGWGLVLAISIGIPRHHLCGVRAVVPGPAAKGADRGILGILGSSGGSGPRVVPAGRATRHGRNRKSVPRLCRGPAAVQHPADGDRHPARRHHRRVAGLGRRQRHRDPVAADLLDVADLGDHHAVLHLLGRAVRRRHHLGAVQYSRRAVVRCDHVRRLSDGAEGPGRRGAHSRVHLFVCRRVVCRHHDYAGCAAGRAVRVAIRAGGKIRGLFPRVLQFRRHEQGAAGQDGRVDDDRICAWRGRPRSDDRQPAPDLRFRDPAHRLRLPDRGDWPVRHRRNPADDGGGAVVQGAFGKDQSQGGLGDVEDAAALLDDVAALLHHRMLDGQLRQRARRQPRS